MTMVKKIKEKFGFVHTAKDKIEVDFPVDGMPTKHDVTDLDSFGAALEKVGEAKPDKVLFFVRFRRDTRFFVAEPDWTEPLTVSVSPSRAMMVGAVALLDRSPCDASS